jgi:hypothetical protein
MGKTKDGVLRVTRLALVIEVVQGWRGEAECVALIASLPNRDDTLCVSWPVHVGGMRADVLEDLMLEADQLITLAVETTVGVQAVLPLV